MRISSREGLRNHRDHGQLYFKGSKWLREVHFSFDDSGLVPWRGEIHFGNSLSVVWDDENSGGQLGEVCLAAMERVFDNCLFDYGYCCVSDQYDEKNMDYSGGGAPGCWFGCFKGASRLLLGKLLWHLSLRLDRLRDFAEASWLQFAPISIGDDRLKQVTSGRMAKRTVPCKRKGGN